MRISLSSNTSASPILGGCIVFSLSTCDKGPIPWVQAAREFVHRPGKCSSNFQGLLQFLCEDCLPARRLSSCLKGLRRSVTLVLPSKFEIEAAPRVEKQMADGATAVSAVTTMLIMGLKDKQIAEWFEQALNHSFAINFSRTGDPIS